MKKNYLDLRPEDELILCCAQQKVDEKTKERVNELIMRDLDWNYLITSSCKNKVNKLLYSQLNQICPEKIPVKYFQILSNNFHKKVKYKLYQTGELFRILKILKKNNLMAIPYKGPILAHLAYKNLALRKFEDISIIIKIEDIEKTKKVLKSQGYKIKYQTEPQKEPSFIKKYEREYIFINNKGIELQVKWNYLKGFFSSPYDLENLWEYNKQKLGGFEYYNPSQENMIIIQCIECVKMQWSRLRCISELAGLIQNADNLNWTEILNKSKKYRLEKILFINLYLIKEFLGSEFPKIIVNKIYDDSVKTISNQIIKKLFFDEEYLLKIRREHHQNANLRFHIRENKIDGFKDYIKTIAFPRPYGVNIINSKFSFAISQPTRFIKENVFKYPKITIKAPYVTTPMNVIKKIFELAELGPEDIIYDLGCGDGRIVIAAAKEFGIKGVGIDIDGQRIKESIRNARINGVDHLTTFLEQDIFEADISDATVVTTYLLPSVNRAIMPKLKKELTPNSRIVTQEFTMGKWKPIKTHIVSYDGFIIPLYLYKNLLE